MIAHKVGDLLQAHRDGVTVIAHQCNCRGVWRAGVHKAIGERWPAVVRQYQARRWRLGDMALFDTDIPGFRVAYLAGQDGYGNASRTGRVYTDLPALELAMRRLREALDPAVDHVGFPLIGAGLAGGHWPDIERVIAKVFAGLPVTIYHLR